MSLFWQIAAAAWLATNIYLALDCLLQKGDPDA